MMRGALIIAAKDVRLLAFRGSALGQALLLGLVLTVLCGLALEGRATAEGVTAAAMFWLGSMFGLILVCNALFALEETGGAWQGLLLAPVPSQAVWLGKALAALALLVPVQAALALATVVFLGQSWTASPLTALAVIGLVDVGAAALGALFGALSRGVAVRESLCSVLLLPLLVPLYLAGIRALGVLFMAASAGAAQADMDAIGNWIGLAAAFDAVFIAAGLALFPFIHGGDT